MITTTAIILVVARPTSPTDDLARYDRIWIALNVLSNDPFPAVTEVAQHAVALATADERDPQGMAEAQAYLGHIRDHFGIYRWSCKQFSASSSTDSATTSSVSSAAPSWAGVAPTDVEEMGMGTQ